MAAFGTRSGAASRAADGTSGRGNSETGDGREAKAAALAEICSCERPFTSIGLEDDLAIRSCERSTAAARACTARREFRDPICRLSASSSFLAEVSSRASASARSRSLVRARSCSAVLALLVSVTCNASACAAARSAERASASFRAAASSRASVSVFSRSFPNACSCSIFADAAVCAVSTPAARAASSSARREA